MSKFKYSYVPEEKLVKKLSPGDAALMLVSAENALSKKGDPMLKIELEITDKFGIKGKLMEYILSDERWVWKLHAVLRCIGREHLYGPSGEIDPDMLLGGIGDCELDEKEEEYNGKVYKKIFISKYIYQNKEKGKNTKISPVNTSNDDEFNDEVPF